MDAKQLAAAVRSAAYGDADALQALLAHYHAALRARVVRDLPAAVARRLDADDVLQQAYVAAFKALKPFAGSSPRPRTAKPGDAAAPHRRARDDPQISQMHTDSPPDRAANPRSSASSLDQWMSASAADPPTGVHFDGPAAFYRWLERIALNEVKNRLRDLRRQRRDVAREIVATAASGTSYPDLLARLSGSGQTPSRQLATQEATAAVLAGLARLTDDQRRVIQLRFLQGLPVAEVVARLGKTEDAVHALCYRGLKELRRLLGAATRWM